MGQWGGGPTDSECKQYWLFVRRRIERVQSQVLPDTDTVVVLTD